MSAFKTVLKSVCTILLLQACGTALAGNNSQIELSDGLLVKDVTSTPKKLSDQELNVLGLIIGKSTLSDVAKKMPNKNIVQKGDASKSQSSLCYSDGKHLILTFSSGEMGGSQKVITFVTLEKGSKPSSCSLENKINSQLHILGLNLGMEKKKILSLKGKPNKELKNLILYNYEFAEGEGETRMDITSILELHFGNDKLIKISLSKIESM
jgi:hypothetical protein